MTNIHTVHRAGDTTLLLCPMPTTTLSVRIICGAGALDEEKPGAAHYLEHIFFKGTDKMPAKAVNRKLARLGDSNAYTCDSRTVFHVDTVSDRGNEAFDLLLDLLLNGRLDEADIETERGPIVEEWRAYKDQAWSCLYEIIEKTAFGVNPTLGDIDSIKTMTRDDLLGFRGLYTADRIVVALVGDLNGVDVDRVKRQIADARWASGRRRLITANGAGVVNDAPVTHMQHSSEQAIVAVLMPKSPSIVDSRAGYHEVIASETLGGGMHSLMWHRIREELGLAYATGAFTTEMRGGQAGVIAYAMVSPDEAWRTLEEMNRTIDGAAENVADDDIETATMNFSFSCARSSQTPSSYARTWLDSWFDDPDIRGHAGFIDDLKAGEAKRLDGVRSALRRFAGRRQAFMVNAP